MIGLFLLNFLVLQWFGVRLTRLYRMQPRRDDAIRPVIIVLGYYWDRWVWPLTGWWSRCRYIKRPSTRVVRLRGSR